MSAEINIIGCLDSSYESSSRVYCYDGLCPTLNTMGGGNRQPMIIDFPKTTRWSDVVSTIRASYYKNGERNITENVMTGKGYEGVVEKGLQYRIRKLTERECWRLMDFPDSDFDKAAEVESRTQLYKQAGNAIVRAVLMALFLQMNIQGINSWNDRTDSEKRTLLEETRCAKS